MSELNLSKVAVGCATADALHERLVGRTRDGEVLVDTRYRPTRHPELVGGSLFWIIKHRLVVRQRILGFAESDTGRCLIRLDSAIVTVRSHPKRAHQGWRYLTGTDAPADLRDGETDLLAEMPPRMVAALNALALL